MCDGAPGAPSPRCAHAMPRPAGPLTAAAGHAAAPKVGHVYIAVRVRLQQNWHWNAGGAMAHATAAPRTSLEPEP